MVAITSGLNTPPIRRLKRTWEQLNARLMGVLATCESTYDSNKNFANYRAILAKITPPCVPFIGKPFVMHRTTKKLILSQVVFSLH